MRKPVASLCLLFAWLCANGALLDGLQVFAWAKMFAGYKQTMSAGAALRETFDPAKPCEMCIGVAEAREAAQQQPLAPLVEAGAEKMLLALHSPAPVVFVHSRDAWPVALASAAPPRAQAVPVPPPRAGC